MKKSMIFVGLLAVGFANAQTAEELKGRVGINTQTPKASLDITRHTGIPETNVQGLLLPNLTQEQRNAMTQSALVPGLQIYNTDKTCVDWWNGSTWQCMDGSLQDNHGAPASFIRIEYYPGPGSSDTATQVFYKNNCPSGQQPKAGISFTGTGVGKGISVQLQDAINKAKDAAYRNFLRQGQDYANIHGECEPAPSVPATDPITIIDPNLKLGNTKYWFSSIYDKDYLDANGEVRMPTTPASWSDQTPDGDGAEEEKTIDVQGIIPVLNAQKDNAIPIAIPIVNAPSTSMIMPGFTSYLEIPAEYTQDGRKGIMVLTWEPTALQTTTKYFVAHIYAKGSNINLKKLDLMKGLGSDHMGLSLGVVKYPINSSDNDPSTWKGELDVRLISAIPDKRFNIETTIALDTQKRHQFMYVPAMGADGKIWLGNNLGADYANLHHSKFNPGQQAKTYNDHHAYGSLAQWGRVFDGHELMTWTSSTSGTPAYNVGWYTAAQLTQFNDNCPAGWRMPTVQEGNNLLIGVNGYSYNSIVTHIGYFAGGLLIASPGGRYNPPNNNLWGTGDWAEWWLTQFEHPSYQYSTLFTRHYTIHLRNSEHTKSYGFNIRCIKN